MAAAGAVTAQVPGEQQKGSAQDGGSPPMGQTRRHAMAVITPEQRREWSSLADRLTGEYGGYEAAIELLDPEAGANPMVERLPFDTITYDHKDDVVVVGVGGGSERYPVVLRHVIHNPQEFLVDLIPAGAAVKVTDSSGTTTLIGLFHPKDGPGS
jgi:hypothetical protein